MGTRTGVHWNGEVNFTYQGRDLVATVEATAEHWYQPGRKYMPNGDPGYPEENEIEDVEFDVSLALKDANTDETVDYVEDMYDTIEAAIYETAEWEEDEPEYDEPDEDYYEEREMARWERECDRCGV